MKLNDIKATGQRIERGAWVRNLPLLPGVALKVRGYGNTDFKKAAELIRGEYSEEQLKTDEVQATIKGRVLHDAILLDWSGLEDDAAQPDAEGKLPPLKYSRDLALQILTDPEMEVFRDAVDQAASVVAVSGQASLETDAKN